MNKVTTVGIDLAKRVFAQYISALRSRRRMYTIQRLGDADLEFLVGVVLFGGEIIRHSGSST